MAIKLSQSLKQTQSLALTPQLQQAIKLLTLSHMEMASMIAKEMVENPMLEEKDAIVSEKDLEKELKHTEKQTDDFSAPDIVEGAKNEIDWDKYIENFQSTSSSLPNTKEHFSSEERVNYENIISEGQSLQEYLEWQVRMEELTPKQINIAVSIIHNINDDGYLAQDLSEIAKETQNSLEDVELIHKVIQKLDPVGCGSKDLKDCLLAQIDEIAPGDEIVRKIITYHLEELQDINYRGLAEKLNVSPETVLEAHQIIKNFNPKPGRLVGGGHIEYIVPDIYIKSISGKLVATLNDEGVPNLSISKFCHGILKSAKGKDKEYVKEKLKSASWLIKSIENRQKTILKVAESIIKNQPDFFIKGPGHLRPLILRDVAGEIGVHESTVSRVTNNKYLKCHLGIFELKYFFNTGVGGKNGGIDIAGETLKLKIKKLIESEDPKKPLSDQKIIDLLAKEDIKIARRTITKYRESMGIGSSSKRKKQYLNSLI